MKLLTAILILSGQYPELSERMNEAVKKIKLEQIRSDHFLCKETVKALLKRKVRKHENQKSNCS